MNEAKAIHAGQRVRDQGFGKRLTQAADNHQMVPPPAHGRLQWFVDQFKARGITVSNQSVSRWLDGGFRPRPDKLRMLAEILGVDQVWLTLGIDGTVSTTELKNVRAVTGGVVLVAAGFIQMAGISFAFAEPADAERSDLDVIAAGHRRRIKVVAGEGAAKDVVFRLPNHTDGVTVIGAMRMDPVTLDFFHITSDLIVVAGKPRGGHTEVKAERRAGALFVKNRRVPKVTDFNVLMETI